MNDDTSREDITSALDTLDTLERTGANTTELLRMRIALLQRLAIVDVRETFARPSCPFLALRVELVALRVELVAVLSSALRLLVAMEDESHALAVDGGALSIAGAR